MFLINSMPLFLWIENDLYGFINKNREKIIPCIYNKVSKMINDHVWLNKDNKWFFSNKEHKNILNIYYQELIDYNGYISIVKDKNRFFIINHFDNNKKTKIKNELTPIEICENEYILVKSKNKYGFINKYNQLVVKLDYDYANPFYGKYSSVMINNKWGVIDKNNKIIIEPKYDSISVDCSGFIKVKLNENVFFIDLNENKYIESMCKKYQIGDYKELFATISIDNKKGYINQFFEIEILKKFDQVNDFNQNYAIVEYKKMFGVLNANLRWSIKPIYKKIIEFDGYSFFVIKKNGQYDHIDANGFSLLKNID